jgi:hypothetical protein
MGNTALGVSRFNLGTEIAYPDCDILGFPQSIQEGARIVL